MAKEIIMNGKPQRKPAPEIEEQMAHVLAFIHTLERDIEGPKHETWMDEELHMQKAVYQSLCVAKWLVEHSAGELVKQPGNQHPGVIGLIDKEMAETEKFIAQSEDVDKMLLQERQATLMGLKFKIKKWAEQDEEEEVSHD